jgi:hypothetical protein
VDNADKITTIDGIPQLKSEFANDPGANQQGLLGGPAGAAAALGAGFGPAGIAAGLIGGSILGVLGSENLGMQVTAAQEKILTPEQKVARAKKVSKSPQYQSYQRTGYPAVTNTFLRNIPAPANQTMTGASTYLGTQATVIPVMPPPPSISVAARPRPKTPRQVFTTAQTQQSFNTFRSGERNMK